jgi:hypothetical protein
MGNDPRWPSLRAVGESLPVASAVGVVLATETSVLGSLCLYAERPDAFDEDSVVSAESFAGPAAAAIDIVTTLTETALVTEKLQRAINRPAVIDQAIGILMSRSGCTAEEAFDKLKGYSQVENRKVSVIAASIVTKARARARAQH